MKIKIAIVLILLFTVKTITAQQVAIGFDVRNAIKGRYADELIYNCYTMMVDL